MTKEIIFTDCRVITQGEVFRGTVRVRDGFIVSVSPGESRVRHAVRLEGDYLLPGLVELHTDALERHFVPRPGVRWPDMAAVVSYDAALAASGITTVLDALALGDTKENSDRLRELEAMARSLKEAAARDLLRVEHLLHLRCEICYPTIVELFERFIPDPRVRLVSLMDHTPGQRQFTRMEKFYQYYQGEFGLSEAEMQDLIQSRRENQLRFSGPHRAAILQICRERRWPVASHDDTTAEHIREAAAAGMVLSEFPTTVEAARAARGEGLQILMGAPNLVLGRSHSGNVSALDLGSLGLLDILSSDYVPMSLLHGAFLLHYELDWPLPQALRTVSANPARIANLSDRGSIEAEKRADLVQVKEDGNLPIIKSIWRSGRRVC